MRAPAGGTGPCAVPPHSLWRSCAPVRTPPGLWLPSPGEGAGRGQSKRWSHPVPLIPRPGTGSPVWPRSGHSGTYVDLGSVEPVLVDNPANEVEASEPGLCHQPRGIGVKLVNWGSCFQQRSQGARSGCPGSLRACPGLGLLAVMVGTWGQVEGTAKSRGCHRDGEVRDTITAGSTERPHIAMAVPDTRVAVCAGRESISIKPTRLE